MADSQLRVAIVAEFGNFRSALSSIVSSASSGFAQIGTAARAMGSQAQAGFNQVKAGATAFQEANSKAKELRETLVKLGEAWLVFKGIEFGKELIFGSLELGEKLKNLSIQTGISRQNLQSLQFAAAATGVSFDRITLASIQLSRAYRQLSTANGSPQIQAGLNVFGLKKSDQQNTYGTLLKIGDALNKTGGILSTSQRAGLSSLLGARSGTQLVPAIENLRELSAELQKSGLVLSEDQLNKLETVNEAYNKLGFVWQPRQGHPDS